MEFLNAFGNWCPGPGLWQAGGHPGWSGWMPFPFGGIIQLLIIGLIIYFTVRLFRKPATHTGPATSEDILKRRFANGEIDEQTFKTMRDALKDK